MVKILDTSTQQKHKCKIDTLTEKSRTPIYQIQIANIKRNNVKDTQRVVYIENRCALNESDRKRVFFFGKKLKKFLTLYYVVVWKFDTFYVSRRILPCPLTVPLKMRYMCHVSFRYYLFIFFWVHECDLNTVWGA